MQFISTLLNSVKATAKVVNSGAENVDDLVNAIGNSRFVLIGEASHGTSEFYLWRALLTKQLIKQNKITIKTLIDLLI